MNKEKRQRITALKQGREALRYKRQSLYAVGHSHYEQAPGIFLFADRDHKNYEKLSGYMAILDEIIEEIEAAD